MPVSYPVDNSPKNFKIKISMRKKALSYLKDYPYILETHGGEGQIFKQCYTKYCGMVIEKDPVKAELLASQRENWLVYEGDCARVLRMSACDGMFFNFVDIDAWGDPFGALDGIAGSKIQWGQDLVLCVTDGIYQQAKLGMAWKRKHLKSYALKYGNGNVFGRYPEIVRDIIEKMFEKIGFRLEFWYASANQRRSCLYYAAVLRAA